MSSFRTRLKLVLAGLMLSLASACNKTTDSPGVTDASTGSADSGSKELGEDTSTPDESDESDESDKSKQEDDSGDSSQDDGDGSSADVTDDTLDSVDTSSDTSSGDSDTSSEDSTDTESDDSGESSSDTDLPPQCDRSSARVMMHTDLGDMIFHVDGARMPATADNFLSYVEEGFYDDTIFDRVIKGFVIQGDGHHLDGTIKPVRDPIAFETHPELKHVDGTLSMGLKSPGDDSGQTEIFVCDGASPHLDGDYAAFGLLEQGFDVLRAIAAGEVMGSMNEDPVDPVVIQMMYCLE